MQIKIAFKAIFLVDRGISRGRNRKAHPKTPRALSGTPQSRTAKRKGNGNTGCTRVTGRELAGKSASTKQPMAMANINKQHFFGLGSGREFSGSSQGCLSVKLPIKYGNEKRKNLNKTHFLCNQMIDHETKNK